MKNIVLCKLMYNMFLYYIKKEYKKYIILFLFLFFFSFFSYFYLFIYFFFLLYIILLFVIESKHLNIFIQGFL